MSARAEACDAAADVHDEATHAYDLSARAWRKRGDRPQAALDDRDAMVERDAAEVDRNRGRLIRAREER